MLEAKTFFLTALTFPIIRIALNSCLHIYDMHMHTDKLISYFFFFVTGCSLFELPNQ